MFNCWVWANHIALSTYTSNSSSAVAWYLKIQSSVFQTIRIFFDVSLYQGEVGGRRNFGSEFLQQILPGATQPGCRCHSRCNENWDQGSEVYGAVAFCWQATAPLQLLEQHSACFHQSNTTQTGIHHGRWHQAVSNPDPFSGRQEFCHCTTGASLFIDLHLLNNFVSLWEK